MCNDEIIKTEKISSVSDRTSQRDWNFSDISTIKNFGTSSYRKIFIFRLTVTPLYDTTLALIKCFVPSILHSCWLALPATVAATWPSFAMPICFEQPVTADSFCGISSEWCDVKCSLSTSIMLTSGGYEYANTML